MKDRINRQNDENLYQPKIHSDRIRSLYQLKLITGIPLTVLLDLAICEFLQSQGMFISESVAKYERSRNS